QGGSRVGNQDASLASIFESGASERVPIELDMRHLKFGVLLWREDATTAGYTLLSPLHGSSTYLIDLRGDVVHQWDHPLINSTYAYLLENGNLLWSGKLPDGPQHMGGRGGLLREYDWHGHV